MGLPTLTDKIAFDVLQNFFNESPFVLFGSGMSCAVDADFGMKALQTHLLSEVPKSCITDKQRKEWEAINRSLSGNSDFEAAMNSIRDDGLLRIVTEETANHICRLDNYYSNQILTGKSKWPAITLFQRLVKNMTPSNGVLHVATTNYDLLAEYAFANERIPYCTGFLGGGVVRKFDWRQAEQQMTFFDPTSMHKKKKRHCTHTHIRLYKVHGSLNVFKHKNECIEADGWRWIKPCPFERVMITPGESKHERLHNYRDVLLHEFDSAIRNHSSFLFLGFGFNDSQLVNNALSEKLIGQSCPAIIITRSSNDRIEEILTESKNTWIICRHEDLGNVSTRIYNSQYSNSLQLQNSEIWQLDKFTSEILGG